MVSPIIKERRHCTCRHLTNWIYSRYLLQLITKLCRLYWKHILLLSLIEKAKSHLAIKMSYIVRNKTVFIGNVYQMQENDETLFIHILEGRDSMRPLILRSVPKVAWIFCGIAWIFLFIASFFRFILYSYLYRKYKEKRLTSIDVLIMVQSIIQHLSLIHIWRCRRRG